MASHPQDYEQHNLIAQLSWFLLITHKHSGENRKSCKTLSAYDRTPLSFVIQLP